MQAIVLGLVQGLTEFLPISSSAHLEIVGRLTGWGDPGATFTAITQLGTELAVLLYFRRRIATIVSRWFRSLLGRGVPRNDLDARMGWIVIIGTIPIVLAGFFLQSVIRTSLRSLWITAIVMIVFGIVLGIADRLGRRTKGERELGYRDGLLIGLAQMLALIPGVSRSGASTSAGLALGYTRPAAAEFSFLLAVPAVFGSGLYETSTALKCTPGVDAGCGLGYGTGPTVAATVVAFVVGFAVIAFLMRYLASGSFLPFVVYRVLLGAVLIALLATNTISAF